MIVAPSCVVIVDVAMSNERKDCEGSWCCRIMCAPKGGSAKRTWLIGCACQAHTKMLF